MAVDPTFESLHWQHLDLMELREQFNKNLEALVSYLRVSIKVKPLYSVFRDHLRFQNFWNSLEEELNLNVSKSRIADAQESILVFVLHLIDGSLRPDNILVLVLKHFDEQWLDAFNKGWVANFRVRW